MKRENLIKAKLSEKQVVDFDELLADDKRALESAMRNADDELYEVRKKIKGYASNHTLTLGDDFVALKQTESDVKSRVALIKSIQEEYIKTENS